MAFDKDSMREGDMKRMMDRMMSGLEKTIANNPTDFVHLEMRLRYDEAVEVLKLVEKLRVKELR